MTDKPIKHLDATGLLCPVPLMLLKQAMAVMNSGEQVSIVVSDEHAELDFETWCERFGHDLEKQIECGAVVEFIVTKNPVPPTLD